MFTTRNDIARSNRKKVIALLNARLADGVDLYSQIKQAHWNVKGPHFIGLHELFDDVAEVVEKYIDELAERAVQLGGVAQGTIRMAVTASSLPEFPTSTGWEAQLHAVADRLAAFGKSVRAAVDEAEDNKDKDTADLFTDVSRDIDKALWMVEAHVQRPEKG